MINFIFLEMIKLTWEENFVTILLQNSNSKKYNSAIKEWISYGERFIELGNYCICGHWIKENCIIVNIKNGNELIVGNCCIKKFEVMKNHYNKTKLSYINMCLSKCKHENDKKYCEIVKEEIEEGVMFNYKQLEFLENISKVKSRFKPNENVTDECYSKSNAFEIRVNQLFKQIKLDIILMKEKKREKKFYTIKGLMNRHDRLR